MSGYGRRPSRPILLAPKVASEVEVFGDSASSGLPLAAGTSSGLPLAAGTIRLSEAKLLPPLRPSVFGGSVSGVSGGLVSEKPSSVMVVVELATGAIPLSEPKLLAPLRSLFFLDFGG